MSSFAQSYQHQCLLEISRRHREAIDPNRVYDGKVIGQDNWDNLAVSTVFAGIAIEAALNDFVLSHCLFVEAPYLQEVFGEVMEQFLRVPFIIRSTFSPVAGQTRSQRTCLKRFVS